MTPPAPRPNPRRAPDGSIVSKAIADSNAQYAKDQASGLVTADGKTTPAYGSTSQPVGDGHTTSGMDSAMQTLADKLHPVAK